MPIKKGQREKASHDDQEKIVLVTTMALFANISDSWGSGPRIIFSSEKKNLVQI